MLDQTGVLNSGPPGTFETSSSSVGQLQLMVKCYCFGSLFMTTKEIQPYEHWKRVFVQNSKTANAISLKLGHFSQKDTRSILNIISWK